MQITNIKSSQIPNRVWLSFGDGSFIPFFVDDVVKLSLSKNQELDQEKYQQIIQASLIYLGREYSLRQVAISPKVEKIIYQKLKIFFRKIFIKYKINYSNINDIIQQIIDYLNSKNLLNEADFVTYFVKKNQKKSRQQISFLLSQLGIKANIQNNDLETIKKIIQKKQNMDKLKLKSLLYRRGFNLSDINAAFDDRSDFR